MSTSKYAATTTVPVGRSRDELEATLTRYGVTSFGVINEPHAVTVAFRSGEHNYRIVIPLPDPKDRRFAYGPGGGARTQKGREDALSQETRARWRALLLVVKARLELAHLLGQPVASAFTEFRVLGDGRTVQEHVTGLSGPPALTWGGEA